jgi:hypothetical protein
MAFRLRDVFSRLEIPIPPAVDLYRRFEIWMVPFRIGVFRERGLAEVVSLGLECTFPGEGTLCVIELLPGPAFVRHGSVSAQVACTGTFAASGALSPLDGAPAPAGAPGVQLGGIQFSAQTRATGGVEASFSFDVATPYVHAIGIGAGQIQWRFDRHRAPLFGGDVEMWAVVALPKKQKELRFRARMFMTARTAFFPTRQETDWQEMTCPLEA